MNFWQEKALHELNRDEWESLCDGCARCCLIKLEDEDTAERYYTNIVCRYLDLDQCRCSEYTTRTTLVPECVTLSMDNLHSVDFMPSTCAYRLLSEGKPLPEWHPLVSGDKGSVADAGISICAFAIPETQIESEDELEEHVITFIE